ncbi:MAG: amino acid ABC transporter permease [Candidatus Bathyarchaeota archaeon]|nr:MAG: amino acid ABC transporter permease [Candidatus Bathyarchaeota archaeon]
MYFLIEYLPLILRGFLVTVQMTFFGVILGLGLGTLLAIGDLYGGRVLSIIIKFYVEFFRGSPLIIQLFIFYYSIPNLLGILIDNHTVGLIVFTLNSAAYQKGYIKGAMESVFEDQMTAALSLGLSKAQSIRHVVLPQAMRVVIPAWSNEFASMAKSTAALLVIAVPELTSNLKAIASWTWRVLETYSFGALIYLIWISVVMKILDIIYNKVKIPEIEITA